MSEMADRVLCEKFEANIFAKNRCQNCFRTVAAHQHGHQELEKHGAKTPDCVAGADEASTHEPLDPLCILVPQCELYVCVDPEDRIESWKEGLEYTQLSCRAQEEPEEARTCLDANITTCIGTDANDPLSRDWEMTRILDSILGSNREDIMYYAGQKEEVQPESLPSDRLRWTEVVSSGRTEFWSCLKAGTRAVSQDQGEGKRKHQAESGYFSLERRKSEPGWASSPPRVSCGTVPRRGDGPGVGGWPTSPVASADRDLGWRAGGSTSEGRHGLMRQEYTVLADLPKPKRLHHRQAFEKVGSSSRTRSPGRVEVERIFGPERRKSETLEAFQALEEGLLERLDSKSLKLAKEGQLVRRQSSPTLRRDVSKQLPRDSAQPSRSGGESLRSGRPDQRHERVRRSQGPSLHSGGAPQHLERESQSRGATLPSGPPHSQRTERERGRRDEQPHHPRAGGDRAPLPPGSIRKHTTESSRSSQLAEAGHSKIPGKCAETKWKSCLNVLHAASPAKTLDTSGASHQRLLERHKESDRKARGKPLLPIGTTERLREDTKDCQERIRAFSPGRGTATEGGDRQPGSPQRLQEVSWGCQEETQRTLSPGRDTGIRVRSHGEASGMFGPGRCAGGSQRETGRSLSPGRSRESSGKSSRETSRSSSPGRLMDASSRPYPKQGSCWAVSRQYSEPCWKSQREEVVEASAAIRGNQGISSGWPGKSRPSSPFAPKKETGWEGCSQPSCSAGLLGTEHKKTSQGPPAASMRPESSPRTQEGLLCHVHAMQLLDREWLSQEDVLHSTKSGHPQQLPRECNWRSQGSPTGWVEDGEQQNEERCSSLGGLANQAGNDWSSEEKPFYQHQPDGAQPLKSSCSSRNQDISLCTSKKQEPDLLNFKKGWMSILSKSGEWTKHWFVLTDSSLRYYRDSNAEEADDLDGEIDLRSCTDVTEYAVQRNYGFQIHTKDGVFTLSAMTSGIRRNWIEALRKSIRPTSVPDVTKLSDSNKENTFRSYGSPKSSFRSEEQRASAGPEGIPKGSSSSRKADGQRHAFDYVELSPLQQGSLSSLGSPQRTRGSARVADSKREELERDQALRSEERRRWFESTASGVLQTDGPVGEHGAKTGVPDSPRTPLTEAQRNRLSEEIERKWQELERLPLKDSKRVPLMALLNQAKGGREDASESLEKEVQLLRSQLESVHAQSEAKSHRDMQIPRGYISQEACERSLAEMENAHQQVMAELQRHHQWEMERLKQEKEQLLSEEAAATAAAIEALKKAHREELNKELSRTRGFQRGFSDMNTLQQQHQSDVESLKRELQVLSEQYSQKCLQIGDLVQKAEEQEQMLQHCQQEGKELLRQNQELQRRLSEEIGQLRAFIATQSSRDGASRNNERSSCELEVLLRVKENELQYLKQEVQCLRDELQMMQKDKKFASRKYQDVYVELNHIKQRSEREIEQLKEHLRLAMAALQEKEILHNSVG